MEPSSALKYLLHFLLILQESERPAQGVNSTINTHIFVQQLKQNSKLIS